MCIGKCHDSEVYVLITVSSSECIEFMQILLLNLAVTRFILVKNEIRVFYPYPIKTSFILQALLERKE